MSGPSMPKKPVPPAFAVGHDDPATASVIGLMGKSQGPSDALNGTAVARATGATSVKSYDQSSVETASMLNREALKMIHAAKPGGAFQFLAKSVPESDWGKVLDELGGKLPNSTRAEFLFWEYGRDVLGLTERSNDWMNYTREDREKTKSELIRLCRVLGVHPLSVAICAKGAPEETYENRMMDGPPPAAYSESLAYHIGTEATGVSRDDRGMLHTGGGITVGGYRDTLPAGIRSIPGDLQIVRSASRLCASLEEVAGTVMLHNTERFKGFPKALRYIAGDVMINGAQGFEGFHEHLEIEGRIVIDPPGDRQRWGQTPANLKIPEHLRSKVDRG